MMQKGLLVLALLCVWGGPAFAKPEVADRQDPGTMFAEAFREDLTPEERIDIMRCIARDHSESRWGDDALWILAQVATIRRDAARSILLRQQILDREESVSLEKFTISRPIYRRSRLPEVEFLLQQTGHLYSGKPGHTTRRNVMPIVLHEELGGAYQSLGMFRSAAREYRVAAKLVPPDGLLGRLYSRRADRMEKKAEIKARKQREDGGGQGRTETPETSRSEKKRSQRKDQHEK
jgi:hypothetical protein